MTEPEPLDSPKGRDRRRRILARIKYIDTQATGWEARAEASALRWCLELLANLSSTEKTRSISQAQAVAIIAAWQAAGSKTTVVGDPILDGLDLERLAIR